MKFEVLGLLTLNLKSPIQMECLDMVSPSIPFSDLPFNVERGPKEVGSSYWSQFCSGA